MFFGPFVLLVGRLFCVGRKEGEGFCVGWKACVKLILYGLEGFVLERGGGVVFVLCKEGWAICVFACFVLVGRRQRGVISVFLNALVIAIVMVLLSMVLLGPHSVF